MIAAVVQPPALLSVIRSSNPTPLSLLFLTRAASHRSYGLSAVPHNAGGRHDEDCHNSPLVRAVDRCRSPSSLPALRALHSTLHHHPLLLSHPAVQIKLIRALAACGDPHGARRLFDASPAKKTVFFNIIIRSYVDHGLHLHALSFFVDGTLRHQLKADNYTFPCVLKACAASNHLCGGIQIHGAVTKLCLDSDLFVGNTLIAVYARCGRFSDASQMFDEMPKRDVVSWNAMIAGYAKHGQFERALDLCKEMVAQQNPTPDSGTLASILPAMSRTEIANVELMRKLFDEMSNKNIVSWNAMIAIYANNSMPREAVDLFSKMEIAGIEPDAVTLASILPACGDSSAFTLGRRIHQLIEMKRMRPNLVLENALMDMYANCGCLKTAREIFDSMNWKDVVSWNSIISAYGMHGHGLDAIAFFDQMVKSGIKPDSIAFLSIISACSHAGLVNQGKHYFNLMTEHYHLSPTIEHYACMVDLLARSGNLNEAYDFIIEMPIKPNERVWGALLNACRIYSNMEIGLNAADHLFKLVPEQSGYYVLLSNIYARAGRWEEVMVVREMMINKGIKKLPGCSKVELWNDVHTFYIGDRIHPRSKEIYEKLDVLMVRLKELGYVTETETALHDVEEEDKEGHLLVHSEKLAVAFMLINTSPETPIRITMNLRMCLDCHQAMKLISSITQREITIKDTNRFHHFVCGVCSCGDYW
ncbi:putative pentatricopeptide repeat-containing protein At3g49142 [Zingiber officinale]|uniref:DYW domain-containing protein n=1 Tax=Zingiber officinale TaxID=94328 RepID=A0A8J5HM96_ZINOF|nr:putative pentatricopeptide repeat-containing protein At3g49142 [Zingiber officinale]KAG6519456.1 hypothetical protein ZIOFF_022950 [Zingiber officinale]